MSSPPQLVQLLNQPAHLLNQLVQAVLLSLLLLPNQLLKPSPVVQTITGYRIHYHCYFKSSGTNVITTPTGPATEPTGPSTKPTGPGGSVVTVTVTESTVETITGDHRYLTPGTNVITSPTGPATEPTGPSTKPTGPGGSTVTVTESTVETIPPPPLFNSRYQWVQLLNQPAHLLNQLVQAVLLSLLLLLNRY